MTHAKHGATTLERVAGGLLVLGVLAGPVGTHVYWMLGGTWGLGRSTTTTGIRIVAVIVVLLLAAAVLVVLARIGLSGSRPTCPTALSESSPGGWLASSSCMDC